MVDRPWAGFDQCWVVFDQCWAGFDHAWLTLTNGHVRPNLGVLPFQGWHEPPRCLDHCSLGLPAALSAHRQINATNSWQLSVCTASRCRWPARLAALAEPQ